MNLPRLKRHPNGKYYVHWVKNRRSARVSTGQDTMRGALLFYADWLKLNIDLLLPRPNPGRALRHLHKIQGQAVRDPES